MNENELFFISEAVRLARKMPLGDCLRFLRGLLAGLYEGHPATNDLRSTIAQLCASDAQLDLIQIGQLKLGMDSIKPVAPHEIPGTQTRTEGSEGHR